MKKTITSFLTLLAISLTAMAGIPNGYYNNAVGKSDEALMTALEGIVYSHTELSYSYLWIAFDSTDVGDDGYYIDMYSNCKYNNQSAHPSGASAVGQGLNREHSFPKSWYDSETPTYTDLHMLLPVDAYVNQRRSNHPYGVCAAGQTFTNGDLTMLGKLGESTYNGYTGTVYEPDDEYKGDLARIYFYIVTCYKSNVSHWTGSDQLDYAANGYKAFSNWSIQMLMEWHRADPVSQKEISRNEAVYKEQGNRNPFVDCPELAEYIWGTQQHTAWTGEGSHVDPITKLVPVMQPADMAAVTGSSFRADWTSGGDVSSYTLKVNQVTGGDEGPALLMSENFTKIVVNADGWDDISGQLDNFTDNPGWTGYKVYKAPGNAVKLGTSNAVGYLVSPELTLASTVTVKFNAQSWISSNGTSDGSSIIVSCGDVSKTVALSATPEEYIVVLNGCTEDHIKLSTTAMKKRLYVYNVDIYNGDLNAKQGAPRRVVVEDGDSTMRIVSGITDTCYIVRNLATGTFKYLVKAVYTDGTESDWSNVEQVTLTAMGDVNNDGLVNITDVTLLIGYVLNDEGSIVIENADLNNDGDINITDVTLLISQVLNDSE